MARKLSKSIVGRAERFLADWTLPRQLAGQDIFSTASRSTSSKELRPRLEQADAVGTSVCPFCAVGCSQLIYVKDKKPIHIEGDPRSPINKGTLCPKGGGTLGMLLSPKRVNTVLHRAPYSDKWEEKPLEWAMDRIALPDPADPRRDLRRHSARRDRRSTRPSAWPRSAARPWTTRRTTSSRS